MMPEHPTLDTFLRDGFSVFPVEPSVTAWLTHALAAAEHALKDPACAHWYVCEGTWFVGLDALPNDAAGRVGGSEPLQGQAVSLAQEFLGDWPALHKGQISVTFPGYPKPRAGESPAGFRYRLNRDAAHVDGVLGEGTPKRRFVREPHAFILGIALDDAPADAAPLVAWQGSHRAMQSAFRAAFSGCAPIDMASHDVTDVYVAARKSCFESCTRVELPLRAGEAVLLHPMVVHGVAPWRAEGATRRAIAYFRPELAVGVPAWLALP